MLGPGGTRPYGFDPFGLLGMGGWFQGHQAAAPCNAGPALPHFSYCEELKVTQALVKEPKKPAM